MNANMKKQLEQVIASIVEENNDDAKKAFHEYLRAKTQSILLGEKADEDKDEDEDEDDKEDKKEDKKSEKKDDDKDDDKKDKKSDKKAPPFVKKDKKEEDNEKCGM